MKAELLLIAGLCLASCAPLYYIPPPQFVPLLKEESEAVAGASFWLGNNGGHAQAQAAVALTDHLGILASGTALSTAATPDMYSLFAEAGPGVFFSLGGPAMLEVYGLAGYGKTVMEDNEADPERDRLEARMVRLGIQPAIALRLPLFEAAVSSRFGTLAYKDLRGAVGDDGEDVATKLRDYGRGILWEPTVTLRFRAEELHIPAERIQAQIQAGYSRNLTDPDFPQQDRWLSWGLLVRFGSSSTR